MTTSNTLIFEGTRWQTARAVHVGPTLVTDGHGRERTISVDSTWVEIAASGRGRRWETETSLGFWRDFYELPPGNIDALVAFVRRYGDPYGALDRGDPTTQTTHWKSLQALLGTAASAWEPVDSDGVSQVAADPKRLKLAEWFLRDNPAPVLQDVESAFDPHSPRLVVRAKTLATFMLLSALSAVARRVSMRHCDYCNSWMEINRGNARFCSGSCRSLYSQHKEI